MKVFVLLAFAVVVGWGIKYKYDELNRLVEVHYDNNVTYHYAYNAAGNIVSIKTTMPDSVKVKAKK